MQSPCLKEASQLCLHGCCHGPLLGFPEPLNKVDKRRSTLAKSRQNFAATTASSILPNAQFTNPESLPSLGESFAEFSKAYPRYSETYRVDQIRAQEYHHLSVSNRTCLDYIGIGLFSYSQLQKHHSENQIASSSSSSSPPQRSPPQNPHIPFFTMSCKMGNLKTQLLHGGQESELESAMKEKIMNFLHISENNYSMVFTANRTSAFKLVAESYPFKSSKKLLTVYDYESEAVEAMVNSSEKKGAQVMSAEFSWPRLRINSAKLRKMLVRKAKKKKTRGLFVFPVHSRVTGTRYPYLWMSIAQENGWHTLIDACALGPKDMDSFGLSLICPDFLICSFYKIFGENPSGFGCLFVKKTTVPQLEDSTSAGMVSLLPEINVSHLQGESLRTGTELEHPLKFVVEDNRLSTSNSFSGPISSQMICPGRMTQREISKFEAAGTTEMQEAPDASSIIQRNAKAKAKANGSLEMECRGLDHVNLLGLTQISNRGRCLINWLVNALMKLKHPNTEEIPLIRVYGPKVKFDRGPALAFNVFDWKGEKVDAPLVQKLADRSNISLSNGFLHHISFSDKYEEVKIRVLERTSGTKEMPTSKTREKDDAGIAVVTVALGFLANFGDAYRLWSFIAQFLDADFVEKAKWRYTALNQKTIEV